jgi:5'-deoxynucleotidase YfbR-like HD superfamily hydrolase
MQEVIERIRTLREAGNVTRAHTIPHHGSYPVGLHTYNMMVLLVHLYPGCSGNLVMAVLHHDAAERWFGDPPSPSKTKTSRMAEAATKEWQFGFYPLTTEEEQWLEAIDKTEFYLWCLDQEALGNRNVYNAKRNTWEWLHRNFVPTSLRYFLDVYAWKRGREIYDLDNTKENP